MTPVFKLRDRLESRNIACETFGDAIDASLSDSQSHNEYGGDILLRSEADAYQLSLLYEIKTQ